MGEINKMEEKRIERLKTKKVPLFGDVTYCKVIDGYVKRLYGDYFAENEILGHLGERGESIPDLKNNVQNDLQERYQKLRDQYNIEIKTKQRQIKNIENILKNLPQTLENKTEGGKK